MIFRRATFLLLMTTALMGAARGGPPSPAGQVVVDVWPEGKMPGNGAKAAEAEVSRNDGFHRITNVSRPTLTLFPVPSRDGRPAPAVIVCPGGGYGYVVVDKEGSEIAAWLNAQGLAALVLKYRVPNNRAGALQDLQRSLSLVRSKAEEWRIDPKRVGTMGFSAGGNLAAKAGAPLEPRSYPAVDAIDGQSCRPDFTMLIYPAYLDDKAGKVSPEIDLQADLPPTLIVHNDDDKTHVVGSKIYAAALAAAGKRHDLKLYPTGGHGYGLHSQGDAKAWPEEARKWLEKLGLAGK